MIWDDDQPVVVTPMLPRRVPSIFVVVSLAPGWACANAARVPALSADDAMERVIQSVEHFVIGPTFAGTETP